MKMTNIKLGKLTFQHVPPGCVDIEHQVGIAAFYLIFLVYLITSSYSHTVWNDMLLNEHVGQKET